MSDFLTPHDYQMALHAQSACNLSGVVFEFAKAMQKICNESFEAGHATDWRNTHPIARLYAEQIAHLASGGGMIQGGAIDYGEAHAECEAPEKART